MRVVIVGGGFAGVKTALELSKRGAKDVTLISDQEYFLHHATLYATATGHSRDESVVKLADIFANHPSVKLVKDTITSLDTHRKMIVGDAASYQYDTLILALGVVTTYFGIQGLAEHAYGIKTLSEVEKFKNHLHEELRADEHKDKTYVVIGAGPTGVELAGALSKYVAEVAKAHNVTRTKLSLLLVEAAPRILPRMSEQASKLVENRLKKLGIKVLTGCKVEAETDAAVIVDGKPVPSDTVVWTSGVANHSFFRAHAGVFQIAPNGRVEVDEHLMAAADIYVLGDNANTRYTGTAYTALHNAKYLARHIMRVQKRALLQPYVPHLFASIIPIGSDWALYERGSVRFAGWIGAKARRLTELRDYVNLLPLSKAYHAWRSHVKREETCGVCKEKLS